MTQIDYMLLPVNKNTKLLIFDCDGTIANNMDIHINAWIKVLKETQIEISSKDLDNYHGLPTEYILKEIFNLDNNSISSISDKIKEASYELLSKTKPIQPVIDLIKYYYKKIPMLVISGGKRKNVYKSLDTLEITHYFEEIITADDNHPDKSKPKAFILLAEKYNIKPKYCHVFEDGVPGLINALKAGMTVTDIRNIDL